MTHYSYIYVYVIYWCARRGFDARPRAAGACDFRDMPPDAHVRHHALLIGET